MTPSVFPIDRGRIEPDQPGGRPSEWAATGRSGGVSLAPFDTLNLAGYLGDEAECVRVNRTRVAGLLGLAGDRLATMDCVHGAEVAQVDGPGTTIGVDALITQRPDLAIVAMGADCLPLALIGADGRTIAVAHCGWRGLAADVLGVLASAMRDHGTQVRQAILGPAICGRCYPVPPERVGQIRARTSPAVAAAAIVVCADGQGGIDVRAGVRARLAELGVAAASIVTTGGCTMEDRSLFSFRRDGLTGRQGLAVCTRSDRAIGPDTMEA